MASFYKFAIVLFLFVLGLLSPGLHAQTQIEWHKSFGTQFIDNALKIFNDRDGNIVVMGTETHPDITGDLRTYLMVTKMSVEGQEIWKQYHDVAFQTNSIAFEYYTGDHFYTEEIGQKIINIVFDLSGKLVLYKLFDSNGEFYSFDNLASPYLAVTNDNVKITATTGCAVQLACYGPDSLTIQKINPVADSNWNTTVWSFGLRQAIRTAPIQGHYDFAVNDIALDEDGNTYILTQIERWDFQFCTDCADAFVDAWNMIFKLDPQGELVGQTRLNITTAVVSNMNFLSVENENIAVRMDDINNSGTAVLTTVFHTDYDLAVKDQFDLDRFYNHMTTDADLNVYAVTNVYDPNDPNIKGESDIIVSKFNTQGELQWESYYGGTSFDFPKGFVLTSDDGIAFLANTQSTDFDIEENHGHQDMWVVKLTETSTAVTEGTATVFSVYPNPAQDYLLISNTAQIRSVSIMDMTGRNLIEEKIIASDQSISLAGLTGGTYLLQVTDEENRTTVQKFVKM